MWPRKQLDVGWRDIAFGIFQVFLPRQRPTDESVVGHGWFPVEEAVVSLSVRSGFDLLLAVLKLPPGSEVIFAAVTIPDMVRIMEHHGLVPVPVDVDAAFLAPAMEEIERAITPQTRAILVAHLFGARIEMSPIIDLARKHGLLVIEDCAQAFIGRVYAGHPQSDCSLFSFGPIKTATALGGAVLRVRDADLRARMLARQGAYPRQSRRAYLFRLLKYAVLRMLSGPRAYGAAIRWCHRLGLDYDRALGSVAHSFGAADFFKRIRQQPCGPLAYMLRRRLAGFDAISASRLSRRIARGDELTCDLPPGTVAGWKNPTHTFWVVPLIAANPAEVIAELRRAGFDATGRSSLFAFASHTHSSEQKAPAAWLASTIFVPNGHDIPEAEWQRLTTLLRSLVVAVPPPASRREPTVASPVAVSL